MKVWIISIFLLISQCVEAQQLRIGIFRDYDIQRIICSYQLGSYQVIADTNDFGAILPNEFVDIRLSGKHIELFKGVVRLGEFSKVVLVENQAGNSLTYTSKSPSVKERKYQGDVEFSADKKGLRIVNLVDMNSYLSGVVESEGGGGREAEYYKVQAVMCRTYALKNMLRHANDSFNLCDRVHCQAYHSMLRFTPSIADAVHHTEGEVLVDDNYELAGTYFHANCGGQTSEAAHVWNSNLPYLTSFRDTFCIYTKQATWEKRVPQQKWADFLVQKYNYPVYDSFYGPLIFSFNQSERTAFYVNPSLGIPLRDLRQEFKLNSTFFSCSPDGMDVVICGRGMGHGVGLCQEGAMRMAKYGYKYRQIALYYFPGLQLVSYDDFLFFRQNRQIPENF